MVVVVVVSGAADVVLVVLVVAGLGCRAVGSISAMMAEGNSLLLLDEEEAEAEVEMAEAEVEEDEAELSSLSVSFSNALGVEAAVSDAVGGLGFGAGSAGLPSAEEGVVATVDSRVMGREWVWV